MRRAIVTRAEQCPSRAFAPEHLIALLSVGKMWPRPSMGYAAPSAQELEVVFDNGRWKLQHRGNAGEPRVANQASENVFTELPHTNGIVPIDPRAQLPLRVIQVERA